MGDKALPGSLTVRVSAAGVIEGLGLLSPERLSVRALPVASPESVHPAQAKQARLHGLVLPLFAALTLLIALRVLARSRQ